MMMTTAGRPPDAAMAVGSAIPRATPKRPKGGGKSAALRVVLHAVDRPPAVAAMMMTTVGRPPGVIMAAGLGIPKVTPKPRNVAGKSAAQRGARPAAGRLRAAAATTTMIGVDAARAPVAITTTVAGLGIHVAMQKPPVAVGKIETEI